MFLPAFPHFSFIPHHVIVFIFNFTYSATGFLFGPFHLLLRQYLNFRQNCSAFSPLLLALIVFFSLTRFFATIFLSVDIRRIFYHSLLMHFFLIHSLFHFITPQSCGVMFNSITPHILAHLVTWLFSYFSKQLTRLLYHCFSLIMFED